MLLYDQFMRVNQFKFIIKVSTRQRLLQHKNYVTVLKNFIFKFNIYIYRKHTQRLFQKITSFYRNVISNNKLENKSKAIA